MNNILENSIKMKQKSKNKVKEHKERLKSEGVAFNIFETNVILSLKLKRNDGKRLTDKLIVGIVTNELIEMLDIKHKFNSNDVERMEKNLNNIKYNWFYIAYLRNMAHKKNYKEFKL